MAMRLLRLRVVPNVGYRFVVWLDTTKTQRDGSPDPDWVARWTFGATPPAGLSGAQYKANTIALVKALAAEEVAKRTPPSDDAGTAAPEEGQDWL